MKFFLLFISMISISSTMVFAQAAHDSEDVLLQEGIDAYYQRNFEKATALFDTILEQNPNNVDALNHKGALLIHLEQYQDAFTTYNEVTTIDPENEVAIAGLQFIEYRLDYKRLDGFMEIQLYNSQGYLVTHFRSKHLALLNNPLAENAINELPITKKINRNGQDYQVLQIRSAFVEPQDDTPGRTGITFGNTGVMFLFAFHYQFVIEEGDLLVYTITIFRPVE